MRLLEKNEILTMEKSIREFRAQAQSIVIKIKKRWTAELSVTVSVIAVLLGAVLSLHGLTNHLFWDDEANTALFARNLMNEKSLTAWDGRNVIGYRMGAELNESLENVYMPPLQYIVAGVGFKLFGENTLGGRILFTMAGILGVLFLALWAKNFMGEQFPWFLPALLLAITPSYLLFIRQCRYYSISVLFTFILLWIWCLPYGKASKSIEQNSGSVLSGWSELFRHIIGIISVVILLSANYLNAVAALGIIPLFFVEKCFRIHQRFLWLLVIYSVAFIVGIYFLITANPFALNVTGDDPINPLLRFLVLFLSFFWGLSYYEFFPIVLILVLLLPKFVKKLHSALPLARRGGFLFGLMLVYIAVIATFSPQPVTRMAHADIRYIVPLIGIGTILSTVIFIILWKLSRSLALIVIILYVFSNFFYINYGGRIPLRSTLYEYVYENFNDYTTSTEAMVDYLQKLPAECIVHIEPQYMTYGPMFYCPRIRYCCQLPIKKSISPDLKAKLPDYIFAGQVKPDFIFIAGKDPHKVLDDLSERFGPDSYEIKAYLPVYWRDLSRPELHLHSFKSKSTISENEGVSVIGLKGP